MPPSVLAASSFLRAELNFHRLFNEALENFDIAAVEARQEASLSRVGIVSV